MKDIKTIQLSDNAPGQSGNSKGMAYTQGCEATIFEDEGEFGYCFHGVGVGGNCFESEDVIGFESVEEAESDARESYKASC